MKIAIPTNDRISIAKRTGRAEEFAIYIIEKGEIVALDYQKNTHSHDDGTSEHHHDAHHSHEHGEHNHDELLEIFKHIDVLLVRAIGKHMRTTLKKGNINYQLVKIDTISDLIENYLNS